MSAERPGKSHVVAWVLSVLAVPVLYVLCYPPIVQCAYVHNWTPSWLYTYSDHYWWLREKLPCGGKTDLWSYFEAWKPVTGYYLVGPPQPGDAPFDETAFR